MIVNGDSVDGRLFARGCCRDEGEDIRIVRQQFAVGTLQSRCPIYSTASGQAVTAGAHKATESSGDMANAIGLGSWSG